MSYTLTGTTFIEALMAPAGGGPAVRQRIGEVRTWSDSSSSSSTDISIIGRVDTNDNPLPRTRAGSGEETVTLEAYLDLDDYPQSQLQKNKKFDKVYIVEIGRPNDLIVYSDVEVTSRNRSGSEFNGLVGVSLSLTVSGGSLENQPK